MNSRNLYYSFVPRGEAFVLKITYPNLLQVCLVSICYVQILLHSSGVNLIQLIFCV